MRTTLNSCAALTALTALALFALLAGCEAAGAGDGSQRQNDNDQESDSSSPTVETVRWKEDGNGYIRYATNDISNYDRSASVMFTQSPSDPMEPIEVEIQKVSGSSSEPFGLVFGAEYGDEGFGNEYKLDITVTGMYRITETVDNVRTDVRAWTSSDALSTGFGAANTVRLELNDNGTPSDTGDDSIEITFNGGSSPDATIQLSEFEEPRTGGVFGAGLTIGDATTEQFPEVPAEMRFKVIEPFQLPEE